MLPRNDEHGRHQHGQDRVTLTSPVTKAQLKAIGPATRDVQWDRTLSTKDAAIVAGLIERFPHIHLRAFGWAIVSPEQVRLWRGVRGFAYDTFDADRVDHLVDLGPQLQALTVGATSSRRLSLKILDEFPELRWLSIERHTKDIDALARCTALRGLRLRSITLPDLTLLAPLRHLWFWVGLGGTRSLRGIESLPRLRYLELWLIKGLADLSPISRCEGLLEIRLQALARVDRLPDLHRLSKLNRLTLDTMKGLRDLTPIARCRSIRDLSVFAGRHHDPADFACLVGHPSLRAITAGLGSDRKNRAVAQLLSLPEPRSSRWCLAWGDSDLREPR